MATSIIGVMSGSSLDGLDMAFCEFNTGENGLTWKIKEARTIPFSAEWKDRLRSAHTLNGKMLMQLDADFGLFIGQQLKKWITENGFAPQLIASHGHTVFHEPSLHFTTQIGSGAHIASITEVDTITSFRSADVASGGQGAPFAPIADRALFAGYDGYLNLGGIANITLRTKEDIWKAWDIAPCNQALNFLAEKTGQAYDRDGIIADTGHIHTQILERLIAMFPGKGGQAFSISNEDIRSSWLAYLEKSNESISDLLATVTEAVARLIHRQIHPLLQHPAKILVTGGGAHNKVLVEKLRKAGNEEIIFHVPADDIVDFKESLLMAYLGYLTVQGKPYGVHGMTGAKRDSIGGAYFKAWK